MRPIRPRKAAKSRAEASERAAAAAARPCRPRGVPKPKRLRIGFSPLCLVWGITVLADSAQFSACVSELAEPEYVGTALTLQTAIGFLLTVVTIRLLPVWETSLGWRWAFAPLAIGPALGTWSMLVLRRRPEAARIAGGRR